MCETMEQFGAKRWQKGFQEGYQETARKIALRLLEMKMPLDQIAFATDLARSEVDALAKGRDA